MAHRDYMARAIQLAKKCAQWGEVPVGAVVVKNDKVIGEGYNTRERMNNTMGHAEIMAIENACKTLGDWRLDGCTLYVTLEPCPMCSGAILNARLERVVYGAPDMKQGAMGGKINLPYLVVNRQIETIQGVCESECLELLDKFFENLRK